MLAEISRYLLAFSNFCVLCYLYHLFSLLSLSLSFSLTYTHHCSGTFDSIPLDKQADFCEMLGQHWRRVAERIVSTTSASFVRIVENRLPSHPTNIEAARQVVDELHVQCIQIQCVADALAQCGLFYLIQPQYGFVSL